MITEAEYRARRDTFAAKLKKDSIAVFFSAEQKIRSNDTYYPYRQNSNFYYLSGFTEDKAALVFVKGVKDVMTYLFVYKKDKQEELWNGKRLGKERAKELFDVDRVFLSSEISKKLQEFLKDKKKVYYDFKLDYSKVKLLKRYAKAVRSFKNAAPLIEEMRLIKSDAEIRLIKEALLITKKAHHQAMKKALHCNYEYELQAELEYVFKKSGAQSDAYTSIVAAGNNANTLHYIDNKDRIKKSELILIDAGCEYNYYASDITRTVCSDTSFSKPQKELYALVLDVQKEIISLIKPGVLRSQLQQRAEFLLCKGMVSLGILDGKVKKLIKKGRHKKYFPHGIGHWMGLDVHDECPYKDKQGKEIALSKGMVLTIEPGLYIDKDDNEVPLKYRGIGIRIEDNILVTEDGYENLSKGITKEIKEMKTLIS